MNTSYRILHCSPPEGQGDFVAALCFEQGCLGIEESFGHDKPGTINAWFPLDTDLQGVMTFIESHGIRCEYTVDEHQDADWNKKWQESVQPVLLAPGVWVCPPWDPRNGDDISIQIEPKMAFGTGHHETTRLCAWMLQKQLTQNSHTPLLLDIGSGSGILCFLALHYNCDHAIGIEIDPQCGDNIAENKAANDRDNKSSFVIGTVDCLRKGACFDVIVMNMIRTHSEPLLPFVVDTLSPGGQCVWSGILVSEREQAIGAAARQGMKVVEEKTENEWWCARLCRE